MKVAQGVVEDFLPHLVEAPGSYSGPVIMAKGAVRKYTPVRHDAEAADDEITKPKAA